jgi:hypothetical protein
MPAQSKAQQRFMGMVHAAQKGDMENPSPEVEKAADSMSDKDAKDYASTSHKGLPNKKENMITRNRLKEIVKEVMVEEEDYQTFFKKALEKTGKSIPDMSDNEKKAFFNKIDAAWDAKGEKNETLVGNQHKLDVDGDGEIEASDLAKLRAKNESSFMDADRKAAAISNVIQLDKKVIKKFIEDNNLDADKIHIFVKKNYPKNAESFVKLMKHPNNSSLKNFINESVNEDYDGPAIIKTGNKNSLKVGEKVTLNTNGKKREYKVVKSNGNGDFVVHLVKESVNEGKKVFKVNPGIGKSKYSISSHDGKKTHKDGSDFYDIEIFNNKVDLEKGIKKYTSNGFMKESVNEAGKHKFQIGDYVKFAGDKARVEKVYTARNGKDMYTIGSSKHGTFEIEAEDVDESVNEARTVSNPIKVDSDTMVQIVGDGRQFRELTAAIDRKTGKPIQKFGFDRGNEIADSKEELIAKLQKKYGKSVKFESVNEVNTIIKSKDGKLHNYPNLKKNDVINFLTKKGMNHVSNEKDLKSNMDFYIVESVNEAISTELPKATIPSAVKQKMAMAIDKIKDAKLSNVQKLQLVAQVVDSLGIDKSQLGSMASKIRSKMESVTEGVSSADMDKIKGAVEAAKSFMSVGAELKKLGMKYTFATEPLPIYIIQPTPNNRVAIVNKKYVSKPDFVVGDIAVGVMEGKSVKK